MDFIKVDVEGDELGVLSGVERLPRRSKATIAFEVSVPCLRARNLRPRAVEDFVRSCGYAEFLEMPSHRAARKVPHLAPELGCDYLAFKAFL